MLSSLGLCNRCQYRRIVQTARSQFLLCERSQETPDFPKYPRLPVLSCRGFAPSLETAGDATCPPRSDAGEHEL